MQLNQVKQSFSRVEQRINEATQACQAQRNTPADLKNSVSELDRQSNQVKQVVQQGQDEDRIRESIDQLDKLSDQAVQACQKASNVDQQVETAVKRARDEISQLKQQLH